LIFNYKLLIEQNIAHNVLVYG